MSAFGAAAGFLAAGIPLLAGFIVLDAIAGTVKCMNGNCGEEMHASEQHAHMKKAHTQEGFDIDGMFGSGGIDLPEGW